MGDSIMLTDIEEQDFASTCSFDNDLSVQESADPTKTLKRNGCKLVYVVLALAAIGFGLATFKLLSSSEEKEFQSEFQSYARETADIAENNADNTFGQLRSLATAITSLAVDSNHGFPNVTIPHFDLRAQEIAELTGAEMIMFVPFVEEEVRTGWEQYAVEHQGWIRQDYDYRGWDVSSIENISEHIYECLECQGISDARKGFDNKDNFMEGVLQNLNYSSKGFHAPIVQYGPAPRNSSLAMMDLFSHPTFMKEFVASLEYDVPVISETIDLDFLLDFIDSQNTTQKLLRSFTLDQVREDFREDSRTIGYVIAVVPWNTFFVNLLPKTVNGIVVKVISDCGKNFTYVINGGQEDLAADGDHHDPKYENMALRSAFFSKEHPKGTSRHCHFDLVIYPSDVFHAGYVSNEPLLYAGLVVAIFVFTAVVFFLYDTYASRRQEKVLSQAARAEAIVTSVFPKQIGLRLIAEAKRKADKSRGLNSSSSNLSSFLASGEDTDSGNQSKPIADLFPNTTIMFADITGFTAWSSSRQPAQVFILLERLYKEFDTLAKRRRVFKVETVGDCYVAVAGLPEPLKGHAVAMARFGGDCLTTMKVLTQQLEMELGPDTSDLGIRIGLHSGPVTAGVLRGDRARFQLFGDTVNTTARIETTGEKNRIHLSKETADLLAASGKSHWFTARKDKVIAKGKGELQTYWLHNIKGTESGSLISSQNSSTIDSIEETPPSLTFSLPSTRTGVNASDRFKSRKLARTVNWHVEILFGKLKQIEERRLIVETKPDSTKDLKKLEAQSLFTGDNKMVLDEVVEIVELPKFDSQLSSHKKTIQPVEIQPDVRQQLHDFVLAIAAMYHDNPFHNFDHASHMTMSVLKLLSRIVEPDTTSDDARDLHDHTYGITSDPLTQFAVVFSAMLHDVDHSGVPNSQLIEEQEEMASLYKRKSVAEQNSIDVAWSLLMEDSFQDLRRAIYATKTEFKRFRQLVVNAILATDIVDKELKTQRNARWDKAFADSALPMKESPMDTTNRKATIVIEHLVQVSDVVHTMQHWQIYRKWNARLFQEMHKAYKEGRADKDPSLTWYEGEIGFFDFYVLPLARKLEECGVFGVSSHEYLNYAQQNRKEWELNGREVVKDLVNMVNSETP